MTALPLKYAIERATQVPAPGGRAGPIARQKSGSIGSGKAPCGARVARDHDDQHGQADADDAGECLQGESGHADREDDQGAESGQGPHAARECAEHRSDDDRAADPARDRVQRHDSGADERALPVGGPGARADRQDRSAEVAADAPAHDQVEGRQAVEVLRGGRGHVHGSHRALPGLLRPRDDLDQAVRQYGAAAGGDEDRVRPPGGADDQGAVDLAVHDLTAGLGRVAHRARVQRAAREVAQLGDELPGHLLRGHDAEGDIRRVGLV